MNEDTLDLQQASDFLHMSPSALRQKVKQGVVKGAKPGKRWIFLRTDLVDYIRSLYPNTVEMSLSGAIHREVKLCHFINAEKRGGSVSQHPTGNEYAALLGLKTKPTRKNTTTR